MKAVVDLSVTSAPLRPRRHWDPGNLFRHFDQGAYFDPSDKTTLFQDLGGTVPVTTDGDSIALMLDKSGNGNHVAQSGPASRPSWRTDGTQGWLEFDGVDDFLVSATLDFSSTDKMCVFAGVSDVEPNPNSAIATYGDSQVPRGFSLFAVSSSSGFNRFRAGGTFGGGHDIQSSRPDPAVYTGLADISVARNVLRANGQVNAGDTYSSPMSDFETGTLYVGAMSDGFYLGGNLHGVMVLGGFPGEAEIGMLEDHLAEKAGVTL